MHPGVLAAGTLPQYNTIQDTQKMLLLPFNNANNYSLLININYKLVWKGEHTDSSRKQLNNRTFRTTVFSIREIHHSNVVSGTD